MIARHYTLLVHPMMIDLVNLSCFQALTTHVLGQLTGTDCHVVSGIAGTACASDDVTLHIGERCGGVLSPTMHRFDKIASELLIDRCCSEGSVLHFCLCL